MTISPFVNVGNIDWVWKGERWQIKWVNLLLVVTKESSDSLFGNGRGEPPAFSFLLLTNSGSQGTASVCRAMSKFYCLPFYFTDGKYHDAALLPGGSREAVGQPEEPLLREM